MSDPTSINWIDSWPQAIRRHLQLASLFLFLFLFSPSSVRAQETTDVLSRSVAELELRIEGDETIVDAAKAKLTTQLQIAKSNLIKTEEQKKRTFGDRAATESAASRSAAFLKETKKLLSTTPETADSKKPLTEIEIDVTAFRKSVAQLKQELIDNESESTRRTSRRPELRSLIESASKKITQAQTTLQSLALNESTLTGQASRVVLLTSQKLAEAENDSLVAEQERYEVGQKADVLRNQRDMLALQHTQAREKLAELELLQAEKRHAVAKQSAEAAATEQTESKNPLLESSYQKNTILAQRIQEIEERAATAITELDNVNSQAKKLGDTFREAEKRVKIGLTGSVGAMLRKRKSELPSVNKSLSLANKIKSEVSDFQYETFDVEQQLEELSAQTIFAEIELYNDELNETQVDALTKPIDDLVVARKQILEDSNKSLDRVFYKLVEIESKERELAIATGKFREYINERILWIRSNELLFSKTHVDHSDLVVFELSSWIDAAKRVGQVISRWPAFFLLTGFAFSLLLVLKPKLRKEVDRLGQIAANGSCDSFWPTARVLVLTVLIAITVPLFLMALGWGLSRESFGDSPLFNSLGQALMAVAWFAIPLEVLRRICRPAGLANEHFDWTDASVEKLKTRLGQIVIPGAGLVFAIALLRNLDQTHHVDLIERVLFVIAMLGFAYFAWKTFSPAHGIFEEYLKANERSWANQLSAVWFGLIIFVPLSLAVLAIWGYYYTAINLAEYAFATFIFAVIAETIREMMKRLILVQRRHVHIQTARRKQKSQLLARKELQKAQAKAKSAGLPHEPQSLEATGSSTPDTDSILDLQHQIDVDESAKQANKLVSLSMILVWGFGVWMIWADALPALKALDNYPLWQTNIVKSMGMPAPVASETASPAPTADANTPEPAAAIPFGKSSNGTNRMDGLAVAPAEARQVTVRNLLVFFVISIVTIISTRNLPSALEMLLLEHLPVDRSFRYAIKSLVSYAIVMIGMILAFRALSISWGNVQWLATALTFGLAFGLQEIFANFVAGIILMLERPMRIGDLITVDGFTGTVTKIRTRATTIVNWDRKEYVIPNKDFITGRLENWTLSDTLNRIVINVGVAYGSDVKKTKRILHDVCQNHHKTVEDPATIVTFEKFGDSSLNFVVRTFINDIDSRLLVIDDLHTEIDEAFRNAGIVIAFPQRDLHFGADNLQTTDLIPVTKNTAEVIDE